MLELTKTTSGDKCTIALIGRLDTTTASQLQDELIPTIEATSTFLDFKKLEYVSSAGLRVLLAGQKVAQAKNNRMVITNVSTEIMEVFEMTGFSGILNFE